MIINILFLLSLIAFLFLLSLIVFSLIYNDNENKKNKIIKISKVNKTNLPVYQHKGDAGFDFFSPIDIVIKNNEKALIKLGLKMEIPEGYELQIRGRSSLALKGIFSHFGTIDSGYSGEIAAILINLSGKDFVINNGDRICQGVVQKIVRVSWELTNDNKFKNSDRGEGGFGSTGK